MLTRQYLSGMAVEPHQTTSPTRRHSRLPAIVSPRTGVGVGIAGLALGMLLGIFGHELEPSRTGELAVVQWFEDHRTGFLTAVVHVLELVGGPKVVPWLLLGMMTLLLVLKRIAMSVASVAMPALGWLPGHFAKGWFPRERPPESLEPVVVYNDVASFPSGHTGFAASITIFLLFALTMYGLRRWWMVVLGVVVILVVALSRLYAAAHFPMDVVGGALMAGGTSLALCPPAAWFWRKSQARNDWLAEPANRAARAES